MQALSKTIAIAGKELGVINRSETGQLEILQKTNLNEVEINVFRACTHVICSTLDSGQPIPDIEEVMNQATCLAVPAQLMGSYIGTWPEEILAALARVPVSFIRRRRVLLIDRKTFPVLPAEEYGGGLA